MASMKNLFACLFCATPVLLSACTTIADEPIIQNGPALAEGSAVHLGQPVAVGQIVATPMRVTEDSRCPINARCVWKGRIVVETRIDGAGWRETLQLTLGEARNVRDHRVMLASAEPGQMAGEETIDPSDYRFTYEGGSIGVAGAH